MAAGQGFKTFTTGEVLTAGDVNGYLMQGINVFASSAARSAAITSPQEGQYSFLKDTNALEYYDGAAWVGAPVGDITAVTAGTGISGGGSSGAVTITNSMATEIAAKGDLIVGTGSQTFDNLTVGANNTVLTADSSTATGLKWAAAASGNFPKLSYVTPSSNFSSSSTSYTDVTGYTITITPVSATNTIQVTANLAVQIGTSSNTEFRIMVDGVAQGGRIEAPLEATEGEVTVIAYVSNLAASAKVCKLQMRAAGGVSTTVYGSSSGYVSNFGVLEVY